MLGAPQPRFRIYTKPKSYLTIAKDIITNRVYKGDDLEKFEEAIAKITKSKYAICMPTARLGIYFALKSIIKKPGQKVILSPITIVDVINMVICAGGIPVFADVFHNTCNIDPTEIERLIDKDTGAVFITHLHGLACDVEHISAICKKHNVPLVEDSAQAFTTRVNDRCVGTFGDAGIFSFGMYKNLNAFYGGMVITSDEKIYNNILREMGNFPYMNMGQYLKKTLMGLATDLSTSPFLFPFFTYWVFKFAYLHNISFINNMVIVDLHPSRKNTIPEEYLIKMTPMQARIALFQLDKVEENNKARIASAQMYHEGLKDISDIILPPLRTDGSHIYTYYPIQVPDRKALMRHAMIHNRDFVLSHYHNCASLECFKEFHRECPEAQRTANQLIYLPTYPRYRREEISRNIEVISSYFKKADKI